MGRKWTMGMFAAMACGGGGVTDDAAASTGGDTEAGSTSNDDGDDVDDADDDAADDDTDDPTATGAGDEQSDEASSTSAAESSSSDDDAQDTTAGTVECGPPVTQSACGNPNSVIRGTATLDVPDGPTEGNLLVLLNHQYLGGGVDGGVPHTGVFYTNADLANGPVAFEIDMCSNGEMWSEENCEFVMHVTLDLDGDNAIDPGEPTGSATLLFLSCMGEGICADVTLDCMDGVPCTAFEDPALCGCAGNGMSCNSPIVSC